jgi:hypothetical protein
LLNIVYPAESFFYPYHLIAGIIATAVFTVILFGLWWFKAHRKKPKQTTGIDFEDVISMGTLIVTLIVSGVYPFFINPMLDYMVNYVGNEKPNILEYNIDITNWGLSAANNVILSMTSDNTKFYGFTSEPFLGNLTRSNTSVQGNAMFSIPLLPPRSHTLINFKADITQGNSDQRLIIFVRSDEKVGYHDVVYTIIFYLGLGIIMVILFIYLVFVNKEIEAKTMLKKIGYYMPPIAIWMLGFTLAYLHAYGWKY